jgi:hypothetical protein
MTAPTLFPELNAAALATVECSSKQPPAIERVRSKPDLTGRKTSVPATDDAAPARPILPQTSTPPECHL